MILILVAVGVELFEFKQKQQYWFGIFELIFANVTAISAALKIQSTILKPGLELSTTLAAASALYLIVRGRSNIAEGRRKQYFYKEWLELKINFDSLSKP